MTNLAQAMEDARVVRVQVDAQVSAHTLAMCASSKVNVWRMPTAVERPRENVYPATPSATQKDNASAKKAGRERIVQTSHF